MDKEFFASECIELLSPELLLPTETFIEERVLEVADEIIAKGIWLHPILVERNTLIIMDGHHRREFARRNSLRRVPCLLLDYNQVTLTSRQEGIDVTERDIIARGLESRPYPPKTTRHILNSSLRIGCSYPLAELAK